MLADVRRVRALDGCRKTTAERKHGADGFCASGHRCRCVHRYFLPGGLRRPLVNILFQTLENLISLLEEDIDNFLIDLLR